MNEVLRYILHSLTFTEVSGFMFYPQFSESRINFTEEMLPPSHYFFYIIFFIIFLHWFVFRFICHGLTNGEKYIFRVRAVNAAGLSEFSQDSEPIEVQAAIGKLFPITLFNGKYIYIYNIYLKIKMFFICN